MLLTRFRVKPGMTREGTECSGLFLCCGQAVGPARRKAFPAGAGLSVFRLADHRLSAGGATSPGS